MSNSQIKTWAEIPNRHFPKEDIQVANRYMKRYSTSQLSMQIKTMRYCLASIRMAIIKTTRDPHIGEAVEKREHCRWEYKFI